MRLSFAIITYRRPELLMRCLESLGRPSRDGDFEVWVGFNGCEPGNGALIAQIAARFPGVRTLEMDRASRGEARNRLIPKTSGEVVYFLDDDTTVPVGFAERIMEKFDRHPETSAVGGPNIAPPDSKSFERAVDFLLCSPWGAGPTRVRHQPRGQDRHLPGWCFALSNLGVRREVFERHHLSFPKECVSAEENLLLFRIERTVGPVLYSPELIVFHKRRDRPRAFWRQVFLSGRGRGQITREEPGSLQAFVLLPILWGIYLLALPWWFRTSYLLAPLWGYAVCGAIECVRLSWKDGDLRAALWLPLLNISGHLTYAVGFLVGISPRFSRL